MLRLSQHERRYSKLIYSMNIEDGRQEPGFYYEGDVRTPAGRYYNAGDAARYVKVSRAHFYVAYQKTTPKYHIPGFARQVFYAQPDLDKIKRLREQMKPRGPKK